MCQTKEKQPEAVIISAFEWSLIMKSLGVAVGLGPGVAAGLGLGVAASVLVSLAVPPVGLGLGVAAALGPGDATGPGLGVAAIVLSLADPLVNLLFYYCF